MLRYIAGLAAISFAVAQQRGPLTPDEHPQFPVKQCTAQGCTPEAGMITMDMNWRWLHNKDKYNNCLATVWDATLCPDPDACAKNCAIEGLKIADYPKKTYGVTTIPMGVSLKWPPGSRFYMLSDDENYKLFKLKNREISMTVDLSTLPCGMNGAIYFVEMAANGGKSPQNTAGANHGTGYCDAQCPRMKFIDGQANELGWKTHRVQTPELKIIQGGNEGQYGACCAEVDVIEANKMGNQFTMHPCNFAGQHKCEGNADCGNGLDQIPGVCDKGGCGFNSYQLGDEKFWGPGADYAVDTTKPVTIVTQFVTTDNTDTGDLSEIRRLYVQDGKVIQNSQASVLGDGDGNSMSDSMCKQASTLFNQSAHNASEAMSKSFPAHGGLKSIGQALDRGMVLAFSIWDDGTGRMLWLDGEKTRIDDEESIKGVKHGPCLFTDGADKALKQDLKDNPADLKVTDLKYGSIGSTYTGTPATPVRKFTVVADADGSIAVPRPIVRANHPMWELLTAKSYLLAGAFVSLAGLGVAARVLRSQDLAFWRSGGQALPTLEQMEFE